jgi:hypothetical protein
MAPATTDAKRKSPDAGKVVAAGPLSAGWRWGQGKPAGARGTSTEGDNV